VGRYMVFGDKGLDLYYDITGLISGSIPKYIKFKPFFSCIILVLTFKMLKEDQALKPCINTL
jgi:hypothetical protein